MRFEHCYAQPLCTPTRVQLMTGLYNVRNYIRFGPLDPKATTFAHLLQKAGYATCIVGKWQLGRRLRPAQALRLRRVLPLAAHHPQPRYANPGLEINGKEIDYTKGEYGPDLVNDYAVDFIERNKDRPFLALLPDDADARPVSADARQQGLGPEGRAASRTSQDRKHFADMVAYMDKMVGRVVARLDEAGPAREHADAVHRRQRHRQGHRVADGRARPWSAARVRRPTPACTCR